MALLVDLADELLDIRGDLGLQRRGQQLPSAVAHDLIEQRPTGRAGRVLAGRLGVMDYLEHWRTFPSRRANADPDQNMQWASILLGRCAASRHPAEGHPQVPIIASLHNRGIRAPGRPAPVPASSDRGTAWMPQVATPCPRPVSGQLGTKPIAIYVTSAVAGIGIGQSRRGYLAGWALQG